MTEVSCSLCSSTMRVERFEGDAVPPFPKGWWLDVVHDHTGDTPQWVAVAYYRAPKGRYPVPAKYVREMQKTNRQEAVVVKQVRNASSGRSR